MCLQLPIWLGPSLLPLLNFHSARTAHGCELPVPVAPVSRPVSALLREAPLGPFVSALPRASSERSVSLPTTSAKGSLEPSDTPMKPGIKLPVSKNGVVKRRRERLTKVIAAPAAVRRIAERCQKILFESTGMTFVNVKFQVPRSKEEALSVINRGIRDMEKSNDSRKMYFLGWAHSQIFSAEMAALGYRFLTAGIRCDTKMTQPPPLEKWLTLERPLGPSSRKKLRQFKGPKSSPPNLPTSNAAPASLNSVAPSCPSTPTLRQRIPAPLTTQSILTSTATQRQAVRSAGTDAPVANVMSPAPARKTAGRIVETIDLT